MNVVINGEAREILPGTTVGLLLEQLGITRGRVAVEVGLEIVPKPRYDEYTLQDGDRIEIVQFVGGG